MIENLLQYARRSGLTAEPGFTTKAVRWAIVCEPQGKLLQVLELGDTSQKKNPGQTFSKCPELLQPEIKRGGPGCRPFLVDSADVVALYTDGPPDPKLLAKHAYFAGLLRKASEVMPELAGLADTIEDPDALEEIQRQLAAQKAKPTDKATFSFYPPASYPVESEDWHDWWRRFRRSLSDDEKPRSRKKAMAGPAEAALVRCLGSGELVEPAPTHPKIAGLSDVGGLAMGDALASFKQEAFCSYGQEQGANAPVSEEIASEYRAALNHLLRETGYRLAGAKVVHWFKDQIPGEDDLLSWWVESPEIQEGSARQRAREMLESIRAGHRRNLADNRYYALTLSGASGRVMIRDWMEGSFPELVENIDAWFDDLEIVRRDGAGLAPPPKLLAILGSLARELKDVPLPLQACLYRTAVRREPIPRLAAAQALERFKMDVLQNETMNHARIGILKAYLQRLPKSGDFTMQPYLDENHPHPAYHCGRLMAMLAALQYRALGDVGAGVVQRYYASASTTPALVLGRLTRTAQFHLDKLDRGLARWHEGRIADTWGRIQSAIPTTLSLEEQSLFALGYYQQIAFDRARTQSPATSLSQETANV